MKYFSEVTNKVYETVDELESAEKAELKKIKEEAAKEAKKDEAAAAVVEKYQLANEALEEANKALKEYNEKYGALHTRVKDGPSTASLVDALFNSFFF